MRGSFFSLPPPPAGRKFSEGAVAGHLRLTRTIDDVSEAAPPAPQPASYDQPPSTRSVEDGWGGADQSPVGPHGGSPTGAQG